MKLSRRAFRVIVRFSFNNIGNSIFVSIETGIYRKHTFANRLSITALKRHRRTELLAITSLISNSPLSCNSIEISV